MVVLNVAVIGCGGHAQEHFRMTAAEPRLHLAAIAETDAERGTLFLNDPQSGELYSRFAHGEQQREIRLLNTSGIAGHVFTTGEGVIVQDAYKGDRFNRTIDQQTGFKTKSVLCAPVRTVKGEIIGVAQALNSRSGRFTKEWMLENEAGQPSFKALRRRAAEHPIEEVGEKLRAMMPWIGESRLVDKSKN